MSLSVSDILLGAGRSQYSSEGSSSNVGAEVGVGVSVGAQTGVYVYAQVSAGSSRSQSDATYYGNTHLAGDTVTLRSQGDTTLRGADARANTINAEVGGALTIESVQDTVTESSKDSGFDARVQVSFGTAWSASANASSAQAGGSYAAVNQQSGLFAGQGGYHVNADRVSLVGGAITSTNAASSDLTANSLTFEHLQNQMDYQARSASIGGGVSGGSGSGSQNSVGQQSADIQNVLTGSTSLGKPSGASFSGGVPMQESGSDASTTYATLTEGNITLGGQRTTAAELGLHTDAATAHTAIRDLPDLQQVLADQQAMSAAAGTVMATSRQVASDLAAHAQANADAIRDAIYKDLTDAERQMYDSMTPSERDLFLSSRSSDFAAANRAANAWGTGGAYSRALGAVSTALVGSVAGQGDVQVLSNALAPYAAQLIGQRFDPNHGSDPNQMAQALSHALLGALLAEVNGSNATGGALAGAGGELAAQLLTQALYPGAAPEDLREDQRQTISALSSLVGALAGGIVGGDSGTMFNAAVGGNVVTNAVENNWLTREEIEAAHLLRAACETSGGNVQACKDAVTREMDAIDAARDREWLAYQGSVLQEMSDELMNGAGWSQEEFVAEGRRREALYWTGTDTTEDQAIFSGYTPAQEWGYLWRSTLNSAGNTIEYFNRPGALVAWDMATGAWSSATGAAESITNYFKAPLPGLYLQNGLAQSLTLTTEQRADLIVATAAALVAEGALGRLLTSPGSPNAKPVSPEPPQLFNGIALHPDLPPPGAGYDYVPTRVEGSPSENIANSHINGYLGEIKLANEIAALGQKVISWGDAVGVHGNDVISVNPATGEVTLWDSKYRSTPGTAIQQSPTFSDPARLQGAIKEAREKIQESSLSPSIKAEALRKLNAGDFTTNTVGSGGARNSVQVQYCGGIVCRG